MARRSQHSFLKRQKEMKRKDEATEKMARRHGKSGAAKDMADIEQQAPDIEQQAPEHADNEADA
jgi:hypothetical protein